MAYSVDLRKKVLRCISAGHNRLDASKIFGVSLRTIVRWLSMERAGSICDPKPHRPWKKLDPKVLIKTVEQNPGYKLRDFAELFKVTTVAICLAFKTLGITRKKRLIYTENEMKKSVEYFWQRSSATPRSS